MQPSETATRINKIINIILLLCIIFATAGYMYLTIPPLFDKTVSEEVIPEKQQEKISEEDKRSVMDLLASDAVDTDEGGMLNVLKEMPKARTLSDDEQNKILNGI